MATLPLHNPPTFRSLACIDLGYCCPWFFFQHNRRTTMIALRLGLSTRTIKIHKARARSGEYVCEKALNCLKAGQCKSRRPA